MTRVEIDLNVRVRGNWTFSGLEDADGPVEAGDIVEVYEAESGLVEPGRVEEIETAPTKQLSGKRGAAQSRQPIDDHAYIRSGNMLQLV